MSYLYRILTYTTMTSLNVKMRYSTLQGRAGTIYYQIIHHRVVRQINTHYHIFPSEWDERTHSIILPDPLTPRYQSVRFIKERIPRDFTRLRLIEQKLKNNNIDYTVEEIIALFLLQIQERSLSRFTQKVIDQLKQLGKERTAETYAISLHSFMQFYNNDIYLDEIDSELILLYEAHLRARGLIPNTTSFYMRTLQSIYNRAVAQGLTPQNYPFKQVFTGVEKTIKRAVSLTVIKRIKELDLSDQPAVKFARDLFLFSFYTRGMSFVDMAYLRKSNLRNGILSYRRRKTDQPLYIKWEDCMQEIIEQYPSSTEFLLPIITQEQNPRRQYLNVAQRVNKNLKCIGNLLNLPLSLSMYTARHSWASVARSKNIPIAVISEGMGHDSESTTQIYLASLDSTVIDRANKLILKSLL